MDWVIRLLLFPLSLVIGQAQPAQALDTVMLRYPVSGYGYGEGGSATWDMTLDPPTEIHLSFAEDGTYILAEQSLTTLTDENREDIPDIIRLNRTTENNYEYSSGDWDEPGTITIHLKIDGELIRGSENISYVMGEEGRSFLLAPVDAPDPRPDDGQRCGTGQRIRLQIGDEAVTGMGSGEIDLYDYIYSSKKISAPVNTVKVIAGPVCQEAIAWWMVSLTDDPDSVAWTPEMQDGRYVLRPLEKPDTPEPFVCGEITSRLSIGAYVLPNFWRLYATPDLDGEYVEVAYDEGTDYRIVDGAECIDGSIWWYARLNEYEGWIRETVNRAHITEPSYIVPLSERILAMDFQG